MTDTVTYNTLADISGSSHHTTSAPNSAQSKTFWTQPSPLLPTSTWRSENLEHILNEFHFIAQQWVGATTVPISPTQTSYPTPTHTWPDWCRHSCITYPTNPHSLHSNQRYDQLQHTYTMHPGTIAPLDVDIDAATEHHVSCQLCTVSCQNTMTNRVLHEWNRGTQRVTVQHVFAREDQQIAALGINYGDLPFYVKTQNQVAKSIRAVSEAWYYRWTICCSHGAWYEWWWESGDAARQRCAS